MAGTNIHGFTRTRTSLKVAQGLRSLRLRTTGPNLPTQAAKPTAAAGDAQATVSWTGVADPSLAEPVTSYLVTTEPGGATHSAAANATSLLLTGLSNGTTYTFTVQAVNRLGNSAPSLPSDPVTPTATATAPGAPTSFAATPVSTDAFITWTAPSSGGSALTGYTLTGLPGGTVHPAAGATSYLATGLTPGTTYNLTLAATNAVGTGSTASVSVTCAATVPGAPTGVTASPVGSTTATVSWAAPASNGGSALTGYTVSGAGSPVTVSAGTTSLGLTGLTAGATYSISVVANNSVGASSAGTVSFTTTSTAPTIAVVSPPLGTGISKSTPLVLDVTDAQGLERAVLLVSQGDTTRAELAYDGSRFAASYAQGSTVSAISGGLRFSLVRAGGWYASPTVEVIAYDVAGKES